MAIQSKPIPELSPEEIEWFWSLTLKKKPADCWEWQGGCQGQGYGNVSLGKRGCRLAHRVAFFLSTQIDPVGKVVRHLVCDNPPCCNPSHLAIGTQKDNVQDARRKGRLPFGDRNVMRKCPEKAPKGVRNGRAKLNDATVIEIFITHRNGLNMARTAKQFGVCIATVSNIVNRRNWKHLTYPPPSV